MKLIRFIVFFVVLYAISSWLTEIYSSISDSSENQIYQLLFQKIVLLISVVGAVVLTYSDFKSVSALKPISTQLAILSIISMMVVMILILSLVSDQMYFLDYQALFYPSLADANLIEYLILIISLVVLAPIYEEIFFRGVLFTWIENSIFGRKGAIIITSLTFILSHNIVSIAGFFIT